MQDVVIPVDTTNSCLCQNRPCVCSELVRRMVPLRLSNMTDNQYYVYRSTVLESAIQTAIYGESLSHVSSSSQTASTYRKPRNALVSRCYKRNTERNNNTRKTASKNRRYICSICYRAFDYKHVLQNHQRTHTGEKPFACKCCNKRFTRDHHLKTHMRLHTGEKPYSCDDCGKKFVQVANLRRHVRVHTGEKPYKCNFENCKLSFSDSNQLKAHRLIHTDERPFVCIYCHVSFRRKHHLLSHNERCAERRNAMMVTNDSDENRPGSSGSSRSTATNRSSGSSRIINESSSSNDSSASGSRSGSDLVVTNRLPVQTEPEDLSINRNIVQRAVL
ncbi:hypothetical protein PGB90_010341 [Kerria lacca]